MKQARKTLMVPTAKQLFPIAVLVGVVFWGLGVVSQALAGEVEIIAVEARQSGETWHFSVTLAHADTGWDHYADLWQVETADGTVLGERVLAHPHVDEQPFTRSLGGVQIPHDVGRVFVRARDTVHGFADQRFEVTLPQ